VEVWIEPVSKIVKVVLALAAGGAVIWIAFRVLRLRRGG
jgi:hypothetical protein